MRARENPFATDRVAEMLPFDPECVDQTWPGLMARLQDMDYRAAIVGPHGSGKTTFLSSLRTRLETQGKQVESLFLNDQNRSLSESDWQCLIDFSESEEVSGNTIIFLDGAEQMSRREWRRLKGLAVKFKGIVITQHRRGKLPMLLKTKTSIEMFCRFVRRLNPAFNLNDGIAERIFHGSKGNVREALWHCYDRVADSDGI